MSSLRLADIREMLDRLASVRPSDDARGRTRSRILEVATARFVAQGYRKTSVDEVARDAGVAKGTIYLHFPTKSELFLSALVVEKNRYVAELRPIFADDVAPHDRLSRYLSSALRLVTSLPLTSRVLGADREFLAVVDELGPEVRDGLREMQLLFLQALLQELPRPGGWNETTLRPRAAALLALGFAAPLIMDERTRSGLSIEQLAQELAQIVTHGVASP